MPKSNELSFVQRQHLQWCTYWSTVVDGGRPMPESGALRASEAPSSETIAAVGRLVNGYQVSQAIHVLVRLGIPDRLAAGPRTAAELAAEVGAHEPSLYRLLRAVAAARVLDELPDERFALTELGEALRSEVPGSLAGWAAFIGRPYYWNVWSRLYEGVMTGKHAFRLEHGVGVWEYRQRDPEEVAIFNRAMNSATSSISPSVVAGYDFSRAATVVDVGGGGGILLTEILKANPDTRGILFDLPATVEDAREFVADSGVGERCGLVAGDFFKSIPPGADVYLLKTILHDWYDEEAGTILKTVRTAARPDSVLLVIEQVLAGPNEGAPGKFGDINMMVGARGQERTREEWEKLFAIAGWQLHEVRPAGRSSILVTRPA